MKNFIGGIIELRIKAQLFKYSIRKFGFLKLTEPILSNFLYKTNVKTFAKKPDKNDKKVKKEKEKDTIKEEYQDISVDEIKNQYKEKCDGILEVTKTALSEIRLQRSNPKILDGIQVSILNKIRCQ